MLSVIKNHPLFKDLGELKTSLTQINQDVGDVHSQTLGRAATKSLKFMNGAARAIFSYAKKKITPGYKPGVSEENF